MIHYADAGVEASRNTVSGAMASSLLAGNWRRLLLAVFAAIAIIGAACGTSDDSASDLEPTADSGPTVSPPATLTPMGEASAFEITTPNHGVFNLERLDGQPVLLNFWYPSCPPCRAELPDLQAAYEAHGDKIQFLGVQLPGLDTAEEAEEFLQDLGITYPSGPDQKSRMVRDFKIVGFPTTIFIDNDHNVVKKHAGILSEGSINSLIRSTVASGNRPDASGS
ncbi:MAG: TlpA disulfide reductase family protein [Dehalococcoidia bacterium]|nr:TlpA disulfide reductase family protein [Dehalococcoidia bacterium]